MVLRAAVARLATLRPHVLMVDPPGSTRARLSVEQWCREFGAVLAQSPADADILVVTGPAGASLSEAIEELWREMPGPRVRLQLVADQEVQVQMHGACRDLVQSSGLDERDDDWASGQPSGHDMSDMSMPGGLDMADRAADRDGMKLDVVPFSLGPVLAGWPTGLTVDLVLQGDVVQQANARPIHGGSESFWSSRPTAARLDCASRLLTLLGWSDVAQQARALRDRLLDVGHTADTTRRLRRLRRRVGRSRIVRAELTGLAVVNDTDALDRLLSWLEADNSSTPFIHPLSVGLQTIEGLELTEARLALASLPVDVDAMDPASSEPAQ